MQFNAVMKGLSMYLLIITTAAVHKKKKNNTYYYETLNFSNQQKNKNPPINALT